MSNAVTALMGIVILVLLIFIILYAVEFGPLFAEKKDDNGEKNFVVSSRNPSSPSVYSRINARGHPNAGNRSPKNIAPAKAPFKSVSTQKRHPSPARFSQKSMEDELMVLEGVSLKELSYDDFTTDHVNNELSIAPSEHVEKQFVFSEDATLKYDNMWSFPLDMSSSLNVSELGFLDVVNIPLQPYGSKIPPFILSRRYFAPLGFDRVPFNGFIPQQEARRFWADQWESMRRLIALLMLYRRNNANRRFLERMIARLWLSVNIANRRMAYLLVRVYNDEARGRNVFRFLMSLFRTLFILQLVKHRFRTQDSDIVFEMERLQNKLRELMDYSTENRLFNHDVEMSSAFQAFVISAMTSEPSIGLSTSVLETMLSRELGQEDASIGKDVEQSFQENSEEDELLPVSPDVFPKTISK